MSAGPSGGHAASVDDLLDRQDSVIAIAQALEFMSEKAVRHRLSSGRWQRLHRSVFVTHSGPILVAQRRWAAVLAVGADAVIAGLTALDLRGYESRTVHLLIRVPRQARSIPAGVIVHRTRTLDELELLPVSRPPRTRAARSLVDAAQWARTDGEARAIIAVGFQQRLVREGDVRGTLDRLTRARRRHLIRQTVDDVVGGAHSLAEIDFVDLCRRNGLPEPTHQTTRLDANGRRRYLDAFFPEWRVHVEVDGGQHLEVRAAWADMHRQNTLWIPGDRVLRFPSWAVRTDPTAVAAQLRAALTSAGWHP